MRICGKKNYFLLCVKAAASILTSKGSRGSLALEIKPWENISRVQQSGLNVEVGKKSVRQIFLTDPPGIRHRCQYHTYFWLISTLNSSRQLSFLPFLELSPTGSCKPVQSPHGETPTSYFPSFTSLSSSASLGEASPSYSPSVLIALFMFCWCWLTFQSRCKHSLKMASSLCSCSSDSATAALSNMFATESLSLPLNWSVWTNKPPISHRSPPRASVFLFFSDFETNSLRFYSIFVFLFLNFFKNILF